MGKNTVRGALAAVCIGALLSSCPSAVSHRDSGVVRVSLGSSASRGVLDAPPYPVFSSARVTVTGTGMSPISAAIVNGVATLEVPEGSDRLVTVNAVPDWTSTAAAYPGKQIPISAKSYGGTMRVDVKGGQTASAQVQLGITESRIFLPDAYTGVVYIADSFNSLSTVKAATITDGNYFTIDRYGRVYFIRSPVPPAVPPLSIVRYTDPTAGSPDVVIDPVSAGVYPQMISIDNLNGRLYYMDYLNGPGYFDGSTESLVMFNEPSVVLALYPESLIAVGEDGAIYITAISDTGTGAIYKFTAGEVQGSSNPYTADPIFMGKISFEAAGLTYSPGNTELIPSDMLVIGDTLYLAANEIDPIGMTSRGKVVALSTDFTSVQTVGWCGDDQSFPVSGKEGEQFYGAGGIIGLAPNKLYVADTGFRLVPTTPVNRVVEVTLSPLGITGIAALPSGIAFIVLTPP